MSGGVGGAPEQSGPLSRLSLLLVVPGVRGLLRLLEPRLHLGYANVVEDVGEE